ncbi:unnamed protein product [Chondrus crispus]|uniref:Bacterial surface antigen (D15) domain-containing protein n=1 Tax=Chondrus crispus TaxID=2769 RepID=R7Q682_CHOCR|nr:unnamed protein product [Chondrus crispus]CDF33504.1 unnamed protein product [Chondrus crispus]|eukprot:XP_005713307.1 unnamed protein product [Chondrus crispus]
MTTDGERETSLDTAFVWRNVRGRLDTLKASASWLGGGGPGSYGHQPSTSFDVHYTQPFVLGLDSSAFARVGQRFRNHLDHSSYTLNVRDCAVGVHLPLGRFSVNSAWREVAAVDDSASPLIREEAGHSWKTSLRHEVARDTRDHPAMPTSGALLSASTELTLPRLGDVAFAKGEAEAQTHVPLGASGAALALSARAGLVCSREGARVRVQDRFFLGGPNSMRGFDLRGVGPRDAADAVGGDTFYTVAAVLSTPVPQTSMLWQLFNARVHAFWCAGDLADISVVSKGVKRVMEGGGLQNKAKAGWGELQKSVRVAAGLGVALETSVGRVELNFCHVLRSAQSDVPSSKFQLGISESFW